MLGLFACQVRVVLETGSLGKSSRVCSVLCVRFRSRVETNKATADTRCTEPRHGVSSTTCDRLGRDMLEALDSALCRRLKGLGSEDQARSPTPTYKNCWCCGSVFHVFCVLCGRPTSVCCVGVRPGSKLAAPPPRGKRARLVERLCSRRQRL